MNPLSIYVLAMCRNEAHIIPFLLRHYSTFAARMVVWDDRSDDGSIELLAAHPLVELRDWPHDNGLDDHFAHDFWYRTFPEFVGRADWLMLIDMDEFILASATAFRGLEKWDAVRTVGFNMVGTEFPKDDGKSQIYHLHVAGVLAPSYSKTVIFKPEAVMRWNYGRHELQACPARVKPEPLFKLLHYRFIGRSYTEQRNSRNYARCGLKSGNKEFAWTCAPEYHGEHSADWAESMIAHAFDVMALPMSEYPHRPHDLHTQEHLCQSQSQ